MLNILKVRAFRHMFAAQVVAITGTGLATVALGLIAFDLAGADAAMVLGIALTIKMVSYVTLAPIAAALASHVPRRTWLVCFDLIRAGVALALPFVQEVWQIYVLIFLMQASSAAFTPAFQATIPDILPDEDDYTKALSLSRLAFDIESLLSPTLAALLLTMVSSQSLFLGTSVGFVASAILVVSVALPSPTPAKTSGFYDRTTRGIRIYLKTPRLRGLLGLSAAAASVSSIVIINTVVIIRSELAMGEDIVALALAAFGGGSMLAAFILPSGLRHFSERRVMLSGALMAVVAQVGLATWSSATGLSLTAVVITWFLSGFGYSATLTPSGRLLKRSAHPEDRPALFAAQFTLSHGCWLVTYPLAGWTMSTQGLEVSLFALSAVGFAGILFARHSWPSQDPSILRHVHPDLAPDHPHLSGNQNHAEAGDREHEHPFVIDALHPRFPPKDR